MVLVVSHSGDVYWGFEQECRISCDILHIVVRTVFWCTQDAYIRLEEGIVEVIFQHKVHSLEVDDNLAFIEMQSGIDLSKSSQRRNILCMEDCYDAAHNVICTRQKAWKIVNIIAVKLHFSSLLFSLAYSILLCAGQYPRGSWHLSYTYVYQHNKTLLDKC